MLKKDRLRPLLLLTVLKIMAVTAVILVAVATGRNDSQTLFLLLICLGQVVALTAAGGLLAIGGRHDPRAIHLGYFFLVAASAFAPTDALGLSEALERPWAGLLLAFLNLRLEIFLPAVLWLFVRDFPAAAMSFQLRDQLGRILRGLWAAAWVLLVAQLFGLERFFRTAPETPGSALADLADDDPTLVVSRLFVVVLCLAAAAFLGWKARRSAGGEKRRGQLFIFAVVGGGSFIALGALVDLATAWPRLYLAEHPLLQVAVVLVLNAVLVTLPFTAAYTVLVEEVLDVRGIARRALQHGLTWAVIKAAAIVPLVVLGVYLWGRRHLPLAEVISGSPLLLAALAVAAFAALRYHTVMLTAIDLHFFPEQYNARRVLTQLAGQVRNSHDLEQLAHLMDRAIRLAWQTGASLLVRDDEYGEMVDVQRELPFLDLESDLLNLLGRLQKPLVIDLALWSSPLHSLPKSDRHWLVDSRIALLVPTFAMDGGLNGLVAVSEKPENEPFAAEDLELMGPVASATGLVIELLELKQGESATKATEDAILSSNRRAMECLVCGGISPPDTQRCGKCDVTLSEASVPYALRRMFRFEERIGTGGMAVVFRAYDLTLRRSVAVKTLPRVSPEAAMRLQREARTAATVSHPGLAAIYGIETWEGIPMLILELLDGGTLSDRLVRGSVPILEVLETGQTVAQALQVIHNLGILHRDIKPSNIGYTRHGSAKLLDFGIARLYEDLRQEPEDSSEVETVEKMTHPSEPLAGTLCYFSPEALDEGTPDPTFDLWSLSVVLYEALTGTNLFFTPRMAEILDAIREAKVPDIREQVPSCPESFADFFRVELHIDKSRRSQSGREYAARLRKISRGLGSGVFQLPVAKAS